MQKKIIFPMHKTKIDPQDIYQSIPEHFLILSFLITMMEVC